MRIAYLLTQNLDSPSGLGRYGPLARAMVRLGHQVEVYALHPDFNSLSARSFNEEGVAVHYVAPMHVKKRGSLKSYYPGWTLAPLVVYAAGKLAQAALSSKADIIHLGKPHPMNSAAGILAKKINRKRLFLDCDDYEAGSNRFANRWQTQGVAFFEQRTPAYAEAVTTNTKFMEQKLVEWGIKPGKIHYLPNGVELSRFTSPSQMQIESLKAALGLQERRVVAFIGSLSLPSHPVDFLVRAFAQVAQQLPEAVLLVVGGGEDFEVLKGLAARFGLQERTIFTGRVPPNEVGQYYALADLSIDPVFDNDAARGRSPLKLFESWACGVPFITADVGDRRELVGDPPAGIVTRPGDEGALADAIINILRDPALADQLKKRGYQRVQEFSWDRLAQKMESVYLSEPDMALMEDEMERPTV